ncbi:MAG TPA: hypothetical protein VGK58_06995, partial [Lacipirellulaceae bacterium]
SKNLRPLSWSCQHQLMRGLHHPGISDDHASVVKNAAKTRMLFEQRKKIGQLNSAITRRINVNIKLARLTHNKLCQKNKISRVCYAEFGGSRGSATSVSSCK